MFIEPEDFEVPRGKVDKTLFYGAFDLSLTLLSPLPHKKSIFCGDPITTAKDKASNGRLFFRSGFPFEAYSISLTAKNVLRSPPAGGRSRESISV